MRNRAVHPFFFVFFYLLFLVSTAGAEELLHATVKSDQLPLRSFPGILSKEIGMALKNDTFLVFKDPIKGREGVLWYRVAYTFAEMIDDTLVEQNTPAYVNGSQLRLRPLSSVENGHLKEERSRIAAQRGDRQSGQWRTVALQEGVADIAVLPDDESEKIIVRSTPSKRAKAIAELHDQMPILLLEARIRETADGDKEGWIRIGEPVAGWLPAECVGLWYSEFFADI